MQEGKDESSKVELGSWGCSERTKVWKAGEEVVAIGASPTSLYRLRRPKGLVEDKLMRAIFTNNTRNMFPGPGSLKS